MRCCCCRRVHFREDIICRAPAAKAASALDPLGVEPRVGVAIAVLLDDVTVDEVAGFPVVVFVVVVAKTGGVVFDGVIALVF